MIYIGPHLFSYTGLTGPISPIHISVLKQLCKDFMTGLFTGSYPKKINVWLFFYHWCIMSWPRTYKGFKKKHNYLVICTKAESESEM